MNDHLHALPQGTELEGYIIERVLGIGGFGITYLAQDIRIGKAVAIKEYMPNEFAIRADSSTVLPKSGADKDDFSWGLERFLDEARTLASLDHPNLNKVLRFFDANATAYMVLDYIEGETLSARLKRDRTLAENELERLLTALLSGLAVVHRGGFVHRDIKPGNIMLRPDGTPVLLDFGAARAAIGQRSQNITTILTPGYAPVEQYDQTSDDIGPWTDIYSLGMVAYRCVSGCTDGGLMDAVARARLLRKGQQDEGLSPAVVVGKGRYSDNLLRSLDKAIEVNEEDRPQSVLEWKQVLAVGKVTAKPDPEMDQLTRRVAREPVHADIGNSGQKNRSPLLIGVAITALLTIGLGGYWLAANDPVAESGSETESGTVVQNLSPDSPAAEDSAATVPGTKPSRGVQVVQASPEASPSTGMSNTDPEDVILNGLDIDDSLRSSRKENIAGTLISYVQVRKKFEACVRNTCANMMGLKNQLDKAGHVAWQKGAYNGLLHLRGASTSNPNCLWRVETYEKLSFKGVAREQERVYCTNSGLKRKVDSSGPVKSL